MVDVSPVFQQTREAYIGLINDVPMEQVAGRLGFRRTPDGYAVEMLGRTFIVGADDIVNTDGRPAAFDVCVLLSRYLIMCPAAPEDRAEWAAFRDFKDAGPLLKYFADNVEGAIAGAFNGQGNALATAAEAMGGQSGAGDLSYDLKYRFQALPRIEMLLLFNDGDEEFGPDCRVLFQRQTERYLDMECVAILGARLAAGLCRFLSGASG
ncbi:MAG: DUF3786 domain-containing protein [Pseudomonadota bacterium]